MQGRLGQHEAARLSMEEALNAIWPFFLKMPRAFTRDASKYLGNLLRFLQTLGQEPNADILERQAMVRAHLDR